ncbi:MAG TPA: hypothetical protein VGP93_06930, partial [Polyangiaceae bacterium]|nr:hypothetical protein [Polyangiaceae bacterium]
MKTTFLTLTLPILVLSATACGQPGASERGKATAGGASTGGASNAGSGGNALAGSAAGGATSTGGSSATGGSGGSGGTGPVGTQVGGVECPSDLGLSSAALLNNVVGTITGGNVRISLDPLGDAHDYRVFVLPKAGEVSGDSIQNATYRCAGEYEVPSPINDDEVDTQSAAVRTRVGSTVQGYARTVAEATLGYVFTTPGAGRIPVYAMGDPALKADNVDCYFMRWPENRVKKYV